MLVANVELEIASKVIVLPASPEARGCLEELEGTKTMSIILDIWLAVVDQAGRGTAIGEMRSLAGGIRVLIKTETRGTNTWSRPSGVQF